MPKPDKRGGGGADKAKKAGGRGKKGFVLRQSSNSASANRDYLDKVRGGQRHALDLLPVEDPEEEEAVEDIEEGAQDAEEAEVEAEAEAEAEADAEELEAEGEEEAAQEEQEEPQREDQTLGEVRETPSVEVQKRDEETQVTRGRDSEGKGKERDLEEVEVEEHRRQPKVKKADRKAEKKLQAAQARKAAYEEKKKLRAAAESSSSSFSPSTALLLRNHPFIERIDGQRWRVKIDYVPDMRVEGIFYGNEKIAEAILEEVSESSGGTGFLPAVRQLANVASLPGILKASLGMPDMHSGYGFSIGGVAAIDYDPAAGGVVAPGGVGFDINCGVRLLRTNIPESRAQELKQKLAQAIFNSVPVGVGSKGGWNITKRDLDDILDQGMEWAVNRGIVWPEDLLHCEAGGRIPNADSRAVSDRAKARGITQTGTLGSGNHYLELQIVDEIFDPVAAEKMGLKLGNLCVMIHSGSRGLGHQVCTDHLQAMGKAKDRVVCKNDRQLTGVKIHSTQGQQYLAAMSAAANYAFVNRSLMTALTRSAFEDVCQQSAKELDMHLVYDVAHNIAKVEDHIVNGKPKKVLVHRKGATRAFAPGHPEVPEAYREVGQPVIIGGSMGTSSYVLTGTAKAMEETFGSTCHGAGRALSRSAAMRELRSSEVLKLLSAKGITVKVASPKLIAEEASEAYKDIDQVIDSCHEAGISKKCVRLRPIAVIKG